MALTLQLITMEKTAEDDGPVPSFDDYEAYEQQLVKEPGHQDFAKKVCNSILEMCAPPTDAYSTLCGTRRRPANWRTI